MTDQSDKKTQPEAGFDAVFFDKTIKDNLRERIKNVMGDLRLPKEALAHLLRQIDETKTAAQGIIAKEVRAFLNRTDLVDVLVRTLTSVRLEVTTSIRIVPSKDGQGGTRIRITASPDDDRETQGVPGAHRDGGTDSAQ